MVMKSDIQANLSLFDGYDFSKEASSFKIGVWYFMNLLFFRNGYFPFSGFKVLLLKIFGANIGSGVLFKPSINIKFPWKLVIGDNCWIGEKVWIDNLDYVIIGSNVCLSQGCLLLTGNHDYTKSSFPYRNKPIIIDDGAWIGGMSLVCSGVKVGSHAILTAGSVATKDLEPWGIYQGNPAVKIRERKIVE